MKKQVPYICRQNTPLMPGHILDIVSLDHTMGRMEKGGTPKRPSAIDTVTLDLSEQDEQDIKEGLCIINVQMQTLERKVDIHNRMLYLATLESLIIDGQLTADAQIEMDKLKITEKDIRIASRLQRIS